MSYWFLRENVDDPQQIIFNALKTFLTKVFKPNPPLYLLDNLEVQNVSSVDELRNIAFKFSALPSSLSDGFMVIFSDANIMKVLSVLSSQSKSTFLQGFKKEFIKEISKSVSGRLQYLLPHFPCFINAARKAFVEMFQNGKLTKAYSFYHYLEMSHTRNTEVEKAGSSYHHSPERTQELFGTETLEEAEHSEFYVLGVILSYFDKQAFIPCFKQQFDKINNQITTDWDTIVPNAEDAGVQGLDKDFPEKTAKISASMLNKDEKVLVDFMEKLEHIAFLCNASLQVDKYDQLPSQVKEFLESV